MKKFISANWYRLILATSFLFISLGFMIYSITSAMANKPGERPNNSFFANAWHVITVKLSPEQLDKIIPKNADGRINISPNEKQRRLITPPGIIPVRIEQVSDEPAGFVKRNDEGFASIYVLQTTPLDRY